MCNRREITANSNSINTISGWFFFRYSCSVHVSLSHHFSASGWTSHNKWLNKLCWEPQPPATITLPPHSLGSHLAPSSRSPVTAVSCSFMQSFSKPVWLLRASRVTRKPLWQGHCRIFTCWRPQVGGNGDHIPSLAFSPEYPSPSPRVDGTWGLSHSWVLRSWEQPGYQEVSQGLRLLVLWKYFRGRASICRQGLCLLPVTPGLPCDNPSVCAAVHQAGECGGTGGCGGMGSCGGTGSCAGMVGCAGTARLAEGHTGWQVGDGVVEAAQQLGSPHQGPVQPGLTSAAQEIYQNATKCAPHPMIILMS